MNILPILGQCRNDLLLRNRIPNNYWYSTSFIETLLMILMRVNLLFKLLCCNRLIKMSLTISMFALRWRHNDHAGVSNHQPHGCLLNRLFRRKSKKTSKLRVTGLCAGPVNFPYKWPVTRKMFPFDDVIMNNISTTPYNHLQWVFES